KYTSTRETMRKKGCATCLTLICPPHRVPALFPRLRAAACRCNGLAQPIDREVIVAVETAAYAMPIGVRTIQKIRFRILPFVFVLFVVALIDRNNIGFAALTMNKELAISSQQFGFIFGIFFFGYF